MRTLLSNAPAHRKGAIVLEEVKVRELYPLKYTNPQLALGVIYALDGILADGGHGFQILADNDPPYAQVDYRNLKIINP
jgi:hypothetical protein